MKLTPRNRKFIAFMSGPGGRIVRGGGGVALAVFALTQLGWFLALLPLAAFMIGTAVVNYCPATLMFPELRGQANIVKDMPSYKLK
jgi:hypothetical protein